MAAVQAFHYYCTNNQNFVNLQDSSTFFPLYLHKTDIETYRGEVKHYQEAGFHNEITIRLFQEFLIKFIAFLDHNLDLYNLHHILYIHQKCL